LNPVRSN